MVNSSYPHFSNEKLAKIARDDVDAFGEIVDRFEKPLIRYILRISKFREEEAQEILQEVFLKAWKNLRGYDDNQKFSSWIYRITHNQTISEFRKAASRGIKQKAEWDDELFGNLPNSIDLPKEINRKFDALRYELPL